LETSSKYLSEAEGMKKQDIKEDQERRGLKIKDESRDYLETYHVKQAGPYLVRILTGILGGLSVWQRALVYLPLRSKGTRIALLFSGVNLRVGRMPSYVCPHASNIAQR
jgi:hypothetical protein